MTTGRKNAIAAGGVFAAALLLVFLVGSTPWTIAVVTALVLVSVFDMIRRGDGASNASPWARPPGAARKVCGGADPRAPHAARRGV